MQIDWRDEVMVDALYHFGITHQSTKCIEEMSELTKEICKNKDGEHNVEHIAEEIADVLITVQQLIMYFNIEEEVNNWKDKKLERLRYRIFTEQYG